MPVKGLQATTATYWGPPCKYGHDGLRYSTSSTCVTCKLEQGKAKYRRRPRKVQAESPLTGPRPPINVNALARQFAVSPRVTGLAEWHRERRVNG